MTQDAHERARQLIAWSDAASKSEQAWLQAHLRDCEACREYADGLERLVQSMRALPVAANRSLVRITQARVRMRAQELKRRRDRLSLVWMCCLLVGVTAAVTTPLLWSGFAWLGGWAGVSTAVWQFGFVMFWIAPTIAASILFLAYGTHLADHNGKAQGS
jgi:predicted anti-sigma-YlaC factor YlaD